MMSLIPWMEIAAAVVAAAIVVIVYEKIFMVALRHRVSSLEERSRDLQRTLKSLERSTGQFALSEARAEAQIRQLTERFGQFELRSNGRPYEQAISLAETGEHAERLVSCFGLAEAEANLISLLHGVRDAQGNSSPAERSTSQATAS